MACARRILARKTYDAAPRYYYSGTCRGVAAAPVQRFPFWPCLCFFQCEGAPWRVTRTGRSLAPSPWLREPSRPLRNGAMRRTYATHTQLCTTSHVGGPVADGLAAVPFHLLAHLPRGTPPHNHSKARQLDLVARMCCAARDGGALSAGQREARPPFRRCRRSRL